MATLFKCCFCQRVDSDFRSFKKIFNLIYCKRNCNDTRLSNNKRKSKTVINKQKGATSKKKSGKGRGKNTNENKQISIGKDDGGYTETLNERGGESQEFEREIERKYNKPVSDFENVDGNSTEKAFPSGHSSHTVKHSDHNTSATEVANSTMIDQVMKISLEVTNANDSSQPVKGKDKQDKNKCGDCAKPNCTKLCNLCKGTFYCSKDCQRKNWSAHKEICLQRLTEEEQEIFKIYEEKTMQRKDYRRRCKEFTEETDGLNNIIIDDSEDTFDSTSDKMYQTLPLKQALIIAPRPVGSFERALCLTRILFPLHDIIIELDDVPLPFFLFFPFLMQPCRFVLLAFIYRFHDNVMRHGVYIKDARDNRCKVEFDLDHIGDDPAPHFSYSQVEPGAYICLLNPVLHLFGDRTLGIRVKNPRAVKILNI